MKITNSLADWVFALDILPVQKYILSTLTNYSNKYNECFLTFKELCNKISMSESTIELHLRSLVKAGYLKVINGDRYILNPVHSIKSQQAELIKQDVSEVFEYWKDAIGSGLDKIPTNLIQTALKKYSVEDLKKAIDGCLHDDFLMGRDEKTSGRAYNTLQYILSDKHIDRLIGYSYSPPIKVLKLSKREQMDADREEVARKFLEGSSKSSIFEGII